MHPAADKVALEATAVEASSSLQLQGEELETAESLPTEEEGAAEEENSSIATAGVEAIPTETPTQPRPHTEFLEQLNSFFAARGVTFQVPFCVQASRILAPE